MSRLVVISSSLVFFSRVCQCLHCVSYCLCKRFVCVDSYFICHQNCCNQRSYEQPYRLFRNGGFAQSAILSCHDLTLVTAVKYGAARVIATELSVLKTPVVPPRSPPRDRLRALRRSGVVIRAIAVISLSVCGQSAKGCGPDSLGVPWRPANFRRGFPAERLQKVCSLQTVLMQIWIRVQSSIADGWLNSVVVTSAVCRVSM